MTFHCVSVQVTFHYVSVHYGSVDGYYTEWSSWNDCFLKCRGGTQDCNRTCIWPLYGGPITRGLIISLSCKDRNCPGTESLLDLKLNLCFSTLLVFRIEL